MINNSLKAPENFRLAHIAFMNTLFENSFLGVCEVEDKSRSHSESESVADVVLYALRYKRLWLHLFLRVYCVVFQEMMHWELHRRNRKRSSLVTFVNSSYMFSPIVMTGKGTTSHWINRKLSPTRITSCNTLIVGNKAYPREVSLLAALEFPFDSINLCLRDHGRICKEQIIIMENIQ